MSFYREKRVKTRKSHKCHGCLKAHPAGSAMLYFATVWFGEFIAGYLCFECRDWIDGHDRYIAKNMYALKPGIIGEMRREEELRDAANWRQCDRVEDG